MISAKARIGIRNSNVEYSGKVTLFCFGPQIQIKGTLTDVSLDVDLIVERNFAVNVNKFSVSSDGDLKLEIENLDSFDYLSEKVTAFCVRIKEDRNETFPFADITRLKDQC